MKQRSHDLKKTKEYAQAMEQVKKNPAAALEAATRAVKSLAIERGLAQDDKSLLRLRSWANDLIARLPTGPGLDLDGSEPPRQPGFSQLGNMQEFVEKFFSGRLPTPLNCIDEVWQSYRRLDALLECLAYADEGRAESGSTSQPIEGYIVDVAKLELEKLTTAAHTLFQICKRAAPNAGAAAGRN